MTKCKTDGCECHRHPEGFRPVLHAVQEHIYADKPIAEGIRESMEKPHPLWAMLRGVTVIDLAPDDED